LTGNILTGSFKIDATTGPDKIKMTKGCGHRWMEAVHSFEKIRTIDKVVGIALLAELRLLF